MITISINPQSAAHIAILSKAMAELLGTTESTPAIEPVVEAAPKKQVKAQKPAPTPDAPVTVTTTPVATAPVETAAASPSKAITLEEVRAKLAALSQGGKTVEVKALLTKHGATKLTDLKAEQYATVLEEAGAL